MKKKLSNVLVFVFFISLVYSKNIYTKEGTITNGDSNSVNKPNYKLEINSDNENTAIFRKEFFGDGVCLVKNGEKISVNYTGAEVSGGGMGGGSSKSTTLRLTKYGKEIDYKNTFVIEKNEIYYLTLYSHYRASNSSPKDTKLISIYIIGVDESKDISLIDRITNFKGCICEYQDVDHGYSLSIYCENVTQKFSNWPVCYVKKGESITINYEEYKDGGCSGGYNSETGQSGGGGFSEGSIFTINGKMAANVLTFQKVLARF